MNILTGTQKAYIAGYIDGDGYIGISRFNKGYHKGEIRIEINISSTNKKPLETIYKWLGFGYLNHKRRTRNRDKWKDWYVYRVNAQKDVLKLIKEIKEFSITRRKQIELLEEYIESRLSSGRIMKTYIKNGKEYKIPQRSPYSDREIEIVGEIQTLNKGGG